ncbi:MAG: sugar ABC transporter permease [Clostridia bacterium]|nr:sugar ABC transporter permease [Clostridia bacterium]
MFPVGLITSSFMYKKILGHSVYRLVFFIPSILSSIVWSTIYKEMVSVEGPIVKVLMWLTSSDEPMLLLADPQYALKTVMGYSIWMGIAGNFILYGGAMSRIPVDVIEAGQLDGIGWLREMVQIIIPLIFPTMGTLLLLQLTGIFTASGNILFLTGGAFDTTTISYFIFQSVYKVPETSNKYNYASAVGLVFTMLTLPIVFVTRWLLNKIEDVQY